MRKLRYNDNHMKQLIKFLSAFDGTVIQNKDCMQFTSSVDEIRNLCKNYKPFSTNIVYQIEGNGSTIVFFDSRI